MNVGGSSDHDQVTVDPEMIPAEFVLAVDQIATFDFSLKVGQAILSGRAGRGIFSWTLAMTYESALPAMLKHCSTHFMPRLPMVDPLLP